METKNDQKDYRVIDPKELPAKLPVAFTLAVVLSLDKFCAPEWLSGIIGFILVLRWISQIQKLWRQESVSVLPTKKDSDGSTG